MRSKALHSKPIIRTSRATYEVDGITRFLPMVNDRVAYIPPWRPYKSSEIEFGVVVSIADKYASVVYENDNDNSTSEPVLTHIVNLFVTEPAQPFGDDVDYDPRAYQKTMKKLLVPA